jgi:hypothetical protein
MLLCMPLLKHFAATSLERASPDGQLRKRSVANVRSSCAVMRMVGNQVPVF